eukprot:5196460-Amphidinium_carterae.2
MVSREKEVYFAKLAEQAERYDEMAEHMEQVERRTQEATHFTPGAESTIEQSHYNDDMHTWISNKSALNNHYVRSNSMSVEGAMS